MDPIWVIFKLQVLPTPARHLHFSTLGFPEGCEVTGDSTNHLRIFGEESSSGSLRDGANFWCWNSIWFVSCIGCDICICIYIYTYISILTLQLLQPSSPQKDPEKTQHSTIDFLPCLVAMWRLRPLQLARVQFRWSQWHAAWMDKMCCMVMWNIFVGS